MRETVREGFREPHGRKESEKKKGLAASMGRSRQEFRPTEHTGAVVRRLQPVGAVEVAGWRPLGGATLHARAGGGHGLSSLQEAEGRAGNGEAALAR